MSTTSPSPITRVSASAPRRHPRRRGGAPADHAQHARSRPLRTLSRHAVPRGIRCTTRADIRTDACGDPNVHRWASTLKVRWALTLPNRLTDDATATSNPRHHTEAPEGVTSRRKTPSASQVVLTRMDLPTGIRWISAIRLGSHVLCGNCTQSDVGPDDKSLVSDPSLGPVLGQGCPAISDACNAAPLVPKSGKEALEKNWRYAGRGCSRFGWCRST